MEESKTGGSEITSYAIDWDQGLGGSFFELQSGSLSTEYTFVVGVDSGIYYNFRYSAVNVHG